jgi:hypothetical protein
VYNEDVTPRVGVLVPGAPKNRIEGNMPISSHDRAVSSLIACGGSFDLVAPVMEKQSGCFVGTAKGVTLRVILKNGKATDIWGDKASETIVEAVKAAIGTARCKVNWLGA